MLLSKSCVYGLQATVLLASKKQNGYVTIRELSDELDISFYFLTKVLQRLTKEGILESYKGPNGGVKLARVSGQITFIDVVNSIDGNSQLSSCILGLPGCGVMTPCPMHDQWSQLKEKILTIMKSVTLEDLSSENNIMNTLTAMHDGANDFFDEK